MVVVEIIAPIQTVYRKCTFDEDCSALSFSCPRIYVFVKAGEQEHVVISKGMLGTTLYRKINMRKIANKANTPVALLAAVNRTLQRLLRCYNNIIMGVLVNISQ